ncbi:MAG: hypothetical protein V3U54_02980 [Thermodesulfobacteriota bacterium]
MNLPRIVCPNKKSLLQSFTGRTVAVRVNSPDLAEEAVAHVRESGNNLFCVIIEFNSPLDDIEFRENQKNIPLAIMVPSLGKFRNLVKHLNMLRDFNLRVYLSCDNHENLVGLRILSSVGIHSCAVFGNGKNDWEALCDLMTYAVLERAPHASIEPFTFIASHYDPFSYLEWSSIHFDDPKHFLHLDAKGRVALSHAELSKKKFIAQSISEIVVTAEFPAIRRRTQAWKRYFVNNHPCASCRGWKVCLGKFAVDVPRNNGCSAFFLEMIEVARQHKAQKAQKAQAEEGRIWQP